MAMIAQKTGAKLKAALGNAGWWCLLDAIKAMITPKTKVIAMPHVP